MWLIVSAPLGLAFGTVTWALLRGRGGLSGLMLFGCLGSLAAFVGSLAAEAVAGYQADSLTGFGAAAGAAAANLFLALSVGPQAVAVEGDD
jgi:hypothetical protein